MLSITGFIDARIVGTTGYHTSQYTEGTLFFARKLPTSPIKWWVSTYATSGGLR